MESPPLPSSPAPPGAHRDLTWAECRAISRVVYDEFSFQSIYALKQGNTAVQLEGKRGEEAVQKARARVAQSKGMVSFLLFMVISAGMLALTSTGYNALSSANGLQIPPAEFTTSVIAGELLIIFSLLWMVGLQIAPTLLGSRVFPLMATLPLSRRDMERVGLLIYAKIFDAPALTAILYLPIALAIVTRDPLAGLLVVPGVVATVLIACAVSLITARFFLVRVSGSRGGTRTAILVRWLYLLAWSIPSLAITAFVSFSVEILSSLTQWEQTNPHAFQALLLLYPFPFAYLPAVAVYPSFGSFFAVTQDPLLAGFLAGYIALAVVSASWLRTAPIDMALLQPRSSRDTKEGSSDLRVTTPAGAILRKDMRIASRTPGLAFLILLPLLDAFILGLSTVVASPSPKAAEAFAFAAVAVAAMLATFFGPAFFATEVMGFSFTRTLPIPRRTLLFGKAALIFIIYVCASVLVMALVAAKLSQPIPFALFAAIELPGVLAAAFLELGVLFHRAERTGIPVATLYSGAWWATLIVVPGLIVAGLPLLVYYLGGRIYDIAFAIPGMAVTALGLFAITASWAIWGHQGNPGA
jgi:predicted permease